MEVELRGSVLVITSNMGFVLSDSDSPEIPQNHWLLAISSHVLASKCDFMALHIQEAGGSDYKKGGLALMHPLYSRLVQLLAPTLSPVCALLDSTVGGPDGFTALSSMYFARNTCPVELYDFPAGKWQQALLHHHYQ